MGGFLSQCVCVSSHHDVHLNILQFYVNYTLKLKFKKDLHILGRGMQCFPSLHSRSAFSKEHCCTLHLYAFLHPIRNEKRLSIVGMLWDSVCVISRHLILILNLVWFTWCQLILDTFSPLGFLVWWLVHGHRPWGVSQVSLNVYYKLVVLKLHCAHEPAGHLGKMQTGSSGLGGVWGFVFPTSSLVMPDLAGVGFTLTPK